MKYFDKVRITRVDKENERDGIRVGEIGLIGEPEIRDNSFFIMIPATDLYSDDRFSVVKIKNLELVESAGLTDEEILKDLPKNNPKWWCKVEDGYIVNLLGEKKNKIPFNYES